ncbi:MAG: hypothetical protein ABGX83_00815 [Nitrospira sp.]|nr:hypothetical protein [Candidatus Manganitrophaceae bacterium]HIK58238.1 hypothetical protein [Nitrospinaceae bacterium]
MEDDHRWLGNISPTTLEKVSDEIESYIQKGKVQCSCGPLTISVETDRQEIYYTARITCKCGDTNDFGIIEGMIPIE